MLCFINKLWSPALIAANPTVNCVAQAKGFYAIHRNRNHTHTQIHVSQRCV